MRTPGEWKLVYPEVLEDGSVYHMHIIGGQRDLVICSFGDSDNDTMAESTTVICSKRDNARFIVKACNLHDELVAALKLARMCLSEHLHAVVNLTTGESIGQRIDKALAKAKEAPDEA